MPLEKGNRVSGNYQVLGKNIGFGVLGSPMDAAIISLIMLKFSHLVLGKNKIMWFLLFRGIQINTFEKICCLRLKPKPRGNQSFSGGFSPPGNIHIMENIPGFDPNNI